MGLWRSDKKVGWVADYCIICRDVQPHRFIHVHQPQSRCDIPAVECSACGIRTAVQPSRYLSIESDGENLSALMERSFPRLQLAVWERVASDKAAVAQDLPTPERLLAVREPFEAVGYLGVLIRHLSDYARRLALATVVFLGIGFLFVAALAGAFRLPPTPTYIAYACLSALAVAAGPIVAAVKRQRAVRTQILPMIARSLRPLRPSDAELEGVETWIRHTRHPLSGLIRAGTVAAAMRGTADRSFANCDADTLIAQARAQSTEIQRIQQRQITEDDSGEAWKAA